MNDDMNGINRRSVLTGTAAGAVLLALPGCVGGVPTLSMTEVIRRLLLRASDNAFARLTEDGGFWDDQVAQLGLSNLLGTRGDIVSRVLTSALVKDRLEETFADIAVEGSFVAAPLVREAIGVIGWQGALQLVQGGPTAASEALRGEMGVTLVEAMVPEVGDAIRIASDPMVSELVRAATGTDVGRLASRLAARVDMTIWNEIGREEAAIRANPQATGDPLLISVFGVGSRL